MSQFRPDINNILLTVQKFINDTAPKLQGEAKYHAIVASYLLGICERELRLSPGYNTKETAQLADFVRTSGPLEELQKSLAKGIRSGAYDAQWDALLDMLLLQTVDNVAVVRPDHLAPMHRAAAK